MIFAQEKENSDIIKKSNLDPSIYFFCRYTLKAEGLFAILSIPPTILSENHLKSPLMKSYSIKKQKYKLGSENINICLSDAKNKAASPNDLHKAIKSSVADTFCSPIQRNSVKRNLNESFGICPEEANDSILNYSIVADEDVKNPLFLKLRISESNKSFASINKLNDGNYPKENDEKEPEITSVRKSTRMIQRKSYADYISPIKSRKRGNFTVSENEEYLEDLNINSRNKKSELLETSKEKLDTSKKSNSEEVSKYVFNYIKQSRSH